MSWCVTMCVRGSPYYCHVYAACKKTEEIIVRVWHICVSDIPRQRDMLEMVCLLTV
jgi:hypothetical protein